MGKIPQNVASLLWDVKTDTLSLKKHAKFIIERVLEYGNTREFEWLKKNFDEEKIKSVLGESRRISTKTGKFYALYYNLEPETLLCIRKPFTQKQNRF